MMHWENPTSPPIHKELKTQRICTLWKFDFSDLERCSCTICTNVATPMKPYQSAALNKEVATSENASLIVKWITQRNIFPEYEV